jgi:hypothetical protein
MILRIRSDKVPPDRQAHFDAIAERIDQVCAAHLNEEYRQLAREATAALCRMWRAPLVRGNPAAWAGGVLHALGTINLLFDKVSNLQISPNELFAACGVTPNQGGKRSREVVHLLKMQHTVPTWCLPSLLPDHPLVWYILIEDKLVDLRRVPRNLQEVAYEMGQIPYIPEPDGTPAEHQPPVLNPGASKIYQLKITLKGVKPPVWRSFQLSGNTTLYSLHEVIQKGMGWYNTHLHEFDFGGRKYTTIYDDDEELGLGNTVMEDGDVTLAHVAPSAGTRFTYLYDFGDYWKHQGLVQKILDPDPTVCYPVCLGGKRACPPEDCGGTPGYEQVLKALADRRNPKHRDLIRWLGIYNPEAFDLEQVNQRLAKLEMIQLSPAEMMAHAPQEDDAI